MAYCTAAELIALFEEDEIIEASNLRDARESDPNDGKIQAAIDGATGIIDGYLMRRYGLPVTVPAEIVGTLKIHALIIARYLLDGSTEEWRQKYEDSIEWLKLFTDPSTKLGGDDTQPGVTDGEGIGSVAFSVPSYFWDRETAEGLF